MVFALMGCAGSGWKAAQEPAITTSTVSLPPAGAREECFGMQPSQQLNYEFTSTQPVDFNVHYHDKGEVFNPVLKDGVTADKGIFIADIEKPYCMMWTNNGMNRANVTYTWDVNGK